MAILIWQLRRGPNYQLKLPLSRFMRYQSRTWRSQALAGNQLTLALCLWLACAIASAVVQCKAIATWTRKRMCNVIRRGIQSNAIISQVQRQKDQGALHNAEKSGWQRAHLNGCVFVWESPNYVALNSKYCFKRKKPFFNKYRLSLHPLKWPF